MAITSSLPSEWRLFRIFACFGASARPARASLMLSSASSTVRRSCLSLASSLSQPKKGWDKELAKDKQLRRTVEDALDSIKEARAGLAEAPKQAKMRHKRHSLGKLLVIAIVGAVIALALSEDLRKKVLDALFGAEEDFQYSSSTGTNSSTSTSTNGSS